MEAKLAIIRIFENNIGKAPSGTKSKGWGPATNIINNKGTSYLLDINTPINSQVGWLLEVKPHYILSYPNNLKALAEYFIKHDLSLDSLKEVRTLGEVVDNEIHEFCSKAWKVKLNDVYSAQETGYIAIQCSENTNYHIQCENAYVEILNEKDDPCKPGEIGRVIVTPLHNFATPLIRYEIGDYAKVGEPCSCGRGLPVLKNILGRSRNLFKLPNGDSFWPRTGIQVYRKYAPILKSQLIQKTLSELELKVTAERLLTENECADLITTTKNYVGENFSITLNQVEDILRSSNGKYEDVVCLV